MSGLVVLIAVHAAYIDVVSDLQAWPALVTIGALLGARNVNPRMPLRWLTAGIAIALIAAQACVFLGLTQPAQTVQTGLGYAWPQAQLGTVPAMWCIWLVFGIRSQATRWEKSLSSVAILSTGSLTGWLMVWPALWGWRGLPLTAAVYFGSMGAGGDLGFKVTGRLWYEVWRMTDYPASMAMSVLITGIGLLMRDRWVIMAGVNGWRFGSGLWMAPLLLTMLLAPLLSAHHPLRSVSSNRTRSASIRASR